MNNTVARVMVDIAHTNVDKMFDYRIPPQLIDKVATGMRVFVPFGAGDKIIEALVIELSDETMVHDYQLKEIQSRIDEYPALRQDQIDLAKRMKERYGCLMVDAIRLMIPSSIRRKAVEGKEVKTVSLVLPKQQVKEIIESIKKKAPNQAFVLEILIQVEKMAVVDLEKLRKGSSTAVRALEKKGLIESKNEREIRRPYSSIVINDDIRPQLNDDQKKAVDAIVSALDRGFCQKLLMGVTGSGKTEVYMHAIEQCIENGRNALVLVPEISLTPQLMSVFASRFGDDIALMHSKLSGGERKDEWERIVTGKARVVIGARSAVFAPLKNIGIIIVDEEQETSYHSQKHPRYSAIEVARMRSIAHESVLLLCSATPSIDTYYRMTQQVDEVLRLPKRVMDRPMPTVELVDMRKEVYRGNRSIFSASLYKRMKKSLSAGEQIILFVNRRGHSTQVACLHCGNVMRCDNCDVTLTYHDNPSRAVCHYCMQEYEVVEKCKECGNEYFRYQGVGTQKVEKQVLELFPDAKTLRMDFDTMQKKDAHLKAQQEFNQGNADILIGTQMIAKGLDFKNVALVGVISADATLFFPEYNSCERAFQLITQVAGRAGRGDTRGDVVVQTHNPDHFAIMCAKEQDYDKFYDQEIVARKACMYPPFGAFVRYLISGRSQSDVKRIAGLIHNKLKAMMRQDQSVKPLMYRAAPAMMEKIKNNWRYEIVIKYSDKDMDKMVSVLWRILHEVESETCRLDLEIRPVNMI